MTGWICTVCGANAPQGKCSGPRCPARRPALRIIPLFGNTWCPSCGRTADAMEIATSEWRGGHRCQVTRITPCGCRTRVHRTKAVA